MSIKYKCGCIEENFSYQTCPIHSEPILMVSHYNHILSTRIRAQKELLSQENILLVNQLEYLQVERELASEAPN